MGVISRKRRKKDLNKNFPLSKKVATGTLYAVAFLIN
jgi:hypothetical protein